MSTHESFLHWVWAAVFILGGGYMMLRPNWLTRIRGTCGWCSWGADGDTQERVRAAVERRQRVEHLPSAIGRYIGAAVIALGIVAALSGVQPAVLYGVCCLILSGITAMMYFQLRNTQPKRVAVLAPRTSASVIPALWYAIAVVNAFSILTFAVRSDARVAAILVCLSSLATMAISSRLTHLPALLSGEDVPAEQLVDDRVRTQRSCNALSLAVVQPFVFCSQFVDAATNVQLATLFFTLAVFLAYMVWAVRKRSEAASLLAAR